MVCLTIQNTNFFITTRLTIINTVRYNMIIGNYEVVKHINKNFKNLNLYKCVVSTHKYGGRAQKISIYVSYNILIAYIILHVLNS